MVQPFNIFYDTSVSKRILGIVISLIILVVFITYLSFHKIYKITEATNEFHKENFIGLNQISRINIEQEKLFGIITKASSLLDVSEVETLKEMFNNQFIIVDKNIQAYLDNEYVSEYNKAAILEIKNHNKEFREKAKNVFDYTQVFAQDYALKLYKNNVYPIMTHIRQALEGMNTLYEVEAKLKISKLLEQSDRFLSRAPFIVFVLIACMCMLSFLMATFISGQLSKLSQIMKTLAEGDLNVEIDYSYQTDEFGTMARALNYLKDKTLEAEELRKKVEEEQLEKQKRYSEIRGAIRNLEEKIEAHISDLLKIVDNLDEVDNKEISEAVSSLSNEIQLLDEEVRSFFEDVRD